jgi:hypothetical protein
MGRPPIRFTPCREERRGWRNLEYFVDLLGLSPTAAIRAATAYGGQIMGLGSP